MRGFCGQRLRMGHDSDYSDRFERLVLPHLDAAFNLARWLTRSDHDAQDVVQEAYLRAFRFFNGFHGEDARTWLLAIVRNTTYTWLRQNRSQDAAVPFDEELHRSEKEFPNPESLVLEQVDRTMLFEGLNQLPVEWREALVLRELEGLSYKEISAVTDSPIGTVMSRLARGRARLHNVLTGLRHAPRNKATSHGM